MAIPVHTFARFKRELEDAKLTCDLFGFILFDDRIKHKPIKDFCAANFGWFDDLASTNDMIFFLPIEYKMNREEEAEYWDGEDIEYDEDNENDPDDNDPYRNCSLRIANEFNIRPNQLPVFLFFTLKQGEMCVEHSAFLRFDAEAFSGGASRAQDLVSDIFSAVGSARRNGEQRELILRLQTEIERIRRAEQIRPLKTWMKEFGLSLANRAGPGNLHRTLSGVSA